jgi:hypothetical protein
MNYEQARNQIQDGDLIAVRGNHLVDKLTRLVTGSSYTHTGVAVWLDDRLFMADINSGRNHLTALSCVAEFDVCEPPAGLERPKIRASALAWLATPIDYGILAFVGIGIRCLLQRALKVRLVLHWRRIIVCSGGSVQIYENAGWPEHSRMISPGELVDELGPPKFSVRS